MTTYLLGAKHRATPKWRDWVAVDLSSTIDLSVIVACWRTADGYAVAAWFFCPEDNLAERDEGSGATYSAWRDDGLIEATPGNTIDYLRIEAKPIELEQLDVREIAFDPHMARQVQPARAGDPRRRIPARRAPGAAPLLRQRGRPSERSRSRGEVHQVADVALDRRRRRSRDGGRAVRGR
jgi:hypothetical protein